MPLIDLKNCRSIMFVRLGKLGDMMVASSVFRAVRKTYPHIKTGLLTLTRSRELFRYNQDIDTVYTWSAGGIIESAFLSRVKPWDILIDLNDDASRRSLMALKIIKHKKSAAFLHEKSAGVYDITIKAPPKNKSHVMDRMKIAAGALGAAKGWEGKPIACISTDRQNLKTKDTVVLNLSAGHVSRYWPVEKWRELAVLILSRDKKIKILVLSSPQDDELYRCFVSGIDQSRMIAKPGTDLNSFISAIASGSILISPDTSAVHAACAHGVPVIGLYPEAKWNFASWRPYGVKNITIKSKTPENIASIGVKEVYEAYKKLKCRA